MTATEKEENLIFGGALVALAVLPFLPLLRGDYLYDDIQVILSNQELRHVTSFNDCLHFVLKPSKPVTNFLIAIGQWLGGGSIAVHRGISILVHSLTTLLLFVTVRKNPLPVSYPPTLLAFWVAALFAIHPLHTESLGIVLFRMEMLGAMFTLSGVWAAQRGNRWLVFLCGGLAAFSKETFGFIYPITVLLFVWPANRRFLSELFVGQLLWGALMLRLLGGDPRSDYPYHDVIGTAVLEPGLHLRLAASALIEGIWKFLTGHDLTVIRLRDRHGFGMTLGGTGAFTLLAAVLTGGLLAMRQGAWWRTWVGALMASVGLYLAIPNINIGSEHYWYFPTAVASALLVGGVATLFPRVTSRPQAMMWMFVVGIGMALFTSTHARLGQMRSRLEFYIAELMKHPENSGVWSDVAVAIMEVPGPAQAEKAKPFIEKARKLDPNNPHMLTAEFLYHFHRADAVRAREKLRELETAFASRPRYVGRFHFHQGLLEESAGEKGRAFQHFGRALSIEPGNAIYKEHWARSQGRTRSKGG